MGKGKPESYKAPSPCLERGLGVRRNGELFKTSTRLFPKGLFHAKLEKLRSLIKIFYQQVVENRSMGIWSGDEVRAVVAHAEDRRTRRSFFEWRHRGNGDLETLKESECKISTGTSLVIPAGLLFHAKSWNKLSN